MPAMDTAARMRMMVNGYQVSQALSVAASLRLSDLLADGPASGADLAAATGTHEGSLRRLLRALVALGVYDRNDDGRFVLTELGATLRHDVAGSVAAWAEFVGRPYYQRAWAGLADSVRTGENAFQRVHGTSVWAYRADRPDEQAIFDRAMTALSAPVADAVAAAYDFGRFATVIDIGGGGGFLLAAILRRHASAKGVLFDQPDVVAAAQPPDRCDVVGGDFFAAVPAGGDAYLLKSVIHDWPDDEAVAILRNCRRAMTGDAVLLLVEQLLDRAPDPTRTAFSDLNMLVAPGGQERELAEYSRLLEAAGFRLGDAVPTGTDVFLIEGFPA
jgi:hypothetical protein